MRKSVSLVLGALVAVALAAAAEAAYTSQHATLVSPGNDSDTAARIVGSASDPGFIDFEIGAGLTAAGLSHLSTDFRNVAGFCAYSSPRFEVELATAAGSKTVYLYPVGVPSPLQSETFACTDLWQGTGDFVPASATPRVDATAIGVSSPTDWPAVVAAEGDASVTAIRLVVAPGASVGAQTFDFDNVRINDDVETFGDLLAGGDADADGIADSIDDDDSQYSNAFADGGAPTFGVILDRGDQDLTLTDEPDPAGVRIVAGVDGGGAPATVSACGITVYTLTAGDEIVVTCGSSTVEVVHGEVAVAFLVDGVTIGHALLAQGAVLTFDDDGLTFTNSGSLPVTVTINGVAFAVAPGHVLTAPHTPTGKNDCKSGGWTTRQRADGSTFKNQGDCIQYVNTGR